MSTRRDFLCVLGAGALAGPLAAFGQPRVWRVGFLAAGAASTRYYNGFRQGMRELGYVEHSNCVLEQRFADGVYERLPGLAADLVRAKVDVIVAGAPPSVHAAHKATATIPIVLVAVPDPVGEGFAASLSRPGRNITGLSTIVTDVSTKHLELLRAAVPKLSRVAVLINPNNSADALILEQINGAAYPAGIRVLPLEAGTVGQIEVAFAAMTRGRAGALIVAADDMFHVQRGQIAKLALARRLPTIFAHREMTEAGGLMSYGQDLVEHYRRAATYVDKILKGARAGELPVEQPTLLEFVINRRTAKALGLAIPKELLLRADRVID